MTLQQLWGLLPQRLAYGHETGDYDPAMSLVLQIANAWYAYRFPALNPDDREDLSQEACIRFWTHIERLKPETCNRYLVRLLLTNYIDMRRKVTRVMVYDPHDTVLTHASYDDREAIEEACFDADMQRLLEPLEYALLCAYLQGATTRSYAQKNGLKRRDAYRIAQSLRQKIKLYLEI